MLTRNVDELENINPETAIYYSFNAASSAPSSSQDPHPVLGPTEALEALQALGCTLATQDWVDNHWRLILWKLAGMACFDPLRENLSEPRWSWNEVMRQLRYRYERELNGGARPALRLITTQDAPASSHMVLCVSNIFWSEGGVDQVGLPIIPHPELEVTDGWYRLRAEVDAPLARAVRKGNLRVGRKIAVAGAKLSRDAEACEVLEAYGKVHLVFSGNASQLAPWDAKLGFQPRPAVATLHSLTPDGGMVQQLDLVVTKVYPIGFIEFFEDENGEKSREGPRKEKEEMKLHEAWLKRREKEEERIRRDFEDKFFFFNEWAERLEQKVGENFRPKDTDVPPPQVETYFERLLDKADYKLGTLGISMNVAGWLARHLREEIAKLHETMHTDMERELKDLVPPRDVRNFRVLFMTDAATSRRPANRVVEVTVWDVLSLALDESAAAGAFREGQRYRVTNLVPSQKSAWMDAGPDSHVYLSTGRGSKWMKMRSA
ncbi:hypothetical protein FA95DRAFT_1486944 [Auriscalpium vulgare]|uniref:Uncharacterized protein n=1 Tax=Auriscalpium vulgare TaxID=40419 RepID=A0ACB8S2E7_9AGAM|nr:hypothetical protein FA95DRAFT_1486944 [Auriscalpium vulgare]